MIILVDKDGKQLLTTLINAALGAGVFKNYPQVQAVVGCIKEFQETQKKEDTPEQPAEEPESPKPVEEKK